jgi:hypothetical protein
MNIQSGIPDGLLCETVFLVEVFGLFVYPNPLERLKRSLLAPLPLLLFEYSGVSVLKKIARRNQIMTLELKCPRDIVS